MKITVRKLLLIIAAVSIFYFYEQSTQSRGTSEFLQVPWLNEAPKNTVLVIGPT